MFDPAAWLLSTRGSSPSLVVAVVIRIGPSSGRGELWRTRLMWSTRRIFFHRLSNGLLIHEFDTENGKRISSILRAGSRTLQGLPTLPAGHVPEKSRSRSDRMRSEDREPDLRCGQYPSLAAYDPTGSILWEAEIPESRQMRLVAGSFGGRPGVQHLLGPETSSQHSLGSVNLVSPTRLLVQLGVIGGYGREIDDGKIHSWFLDRTTGTFTQQTGFLPRILAVGKNALCFVGNVPHPMLVRAGRTVLDGA